ncbi:MAG: hypothetical protein ACHQWH_01740 [Nitrososphaerales archaeon]
MKPSCFCYSTNTDSKSVNEKKHIQKKAVGIIIISTGGHEVKSLALIVVDS